MRDATGAEVHELVRRVARRARWVLRLPQEPGWVLFVERRVARWMVAERVEVHLEGERIPASEIRRLAAAYARRWRGQ